MTISIDLDDDEYKLKEAFNMAMSLNSKGIKKVIAEISLRELSNHMLSYNGFKAMIKEVSNDDVVAFFIELKTWLDTVMDRKVCNINGQALVTYINHLALY